MSSDIVENASTTSTRQSGTHPALQRFPFAMDLADVMVTSHAVISLAIATIYWDGQFTYWQIITGSE
jgi:hypothetical protein